MDIFPCFPALVKMPCDVLIPHPSSSTGLQNEDGCLLGCSAVCCLHHQGIALMMEAARTSETLVNFFQTTRRYNPEDSHLRTHRRENLKSCGFQNVSVSENFLLRRNKPEGLICVSGKTD
jgi:hypothetical protein